MDFVGGDDHSGGGYFGAALLGGEMGFASGDGFHFIGNLAVARFFELGFAIGVARLGEIHGGGVARLGHAGRVGGGECVSGADAWGIGEGAGGGAAAAGVLAKWG